VNSYDDTLRVFDRGYYGYGSEAMSAPPGDGGTPLDELPPQPAEPTSSRASRTHDDEPVGALAEAGALGSPSGRSVGGSTGAKDGINHGGGETSGFGVDSDEGDSTLYAACVHALVGGHRNRAYPIRSAFRVGSDYTRANSRVTARASVVDLTADNMDDRRRYESSSYPADATLEAAESALPTVQSTVLLATGSADGDAYVYDVGGPSNTGELVQRLRGHTDRVYAVDFHPLEPVLASCSADFTIRLWAPSQRARRLRPV